MKIIGGVVVLVAIIIFAWVSLRGSSEQQVSKLDTIDTVVDFYHKWLKAAQSTETDPYKEGLAESSILSKALRSQLKEAQKNKDTTIDPVLCQTVTPESISTRNVNMVENNAQVLVMSRDKKVTEQALVTLVRYNDGWYIDSITCSGGEFEAEREFSFEREGYLLKGSMPAPYNSKIWHLVFEENGQQGHAAPLLFDSESQCTDLAGSKSTCNPDQFTEATKVFVRGQMTESGANVKQLEFVK